MDGKSHLHIPNGKHRRHSYGGESPINDLQNKVVEVKNYNVVLTVTTKKSLFSR